MIIKKAAALAAAVAALGAIAASADAAVLQCGAVITQDTRLDADVGPCAGNPAPAILIDAPDVTLDLHGHRVFGNGNDPFSIGIQPQGGIATGVTVTNGRVEGFGFGVNVSSGSTASRLAIANTGVGIFPIGASDVTITRNRITDSTIGIEPDFTTNAVITRNRIRNCGTGGIVSIFSNGGNSYERNLVTDCAGNGFDLDLAAPDDTLVDNRALRNGADGIHVGHSGGTTLTRNRAENNTGDGIDVTGGTDGGRNRAKRNGGVQCTGVSCRP